MPWKTPKRLGTKGDPASFPCRVDGKNPSHDFNWPLTSLCWEVAPQKQLQKKTKLISMTRVTETFDVRSSLCYHHCQRTWVEYNGYNDNILKVRHLSYSTLTHIHTDENPIHANFQTSCIICICINLQTL